MNSSTIICETRYSTGVWGSAQEQWTRRYVYDGWQTKWDLDFGTETSSQFSWGLYDYGLRFYQPEHGRFINRDPIREAGGLNLYEAFGGDPVNNWDFLGLHVFVVDDIARTVDAEFHVYFGNIVERADRLDIINAIREQFRGQIGGYKWTSSVKVVDRTDNDVFKFYWVLNLPRNNDGLQPTGMAAPMTGHVFLNPDAKNIRFVVAHEVGHNINMRHVDFGLEYLMFERAGPFFPGKIDDQNAFNALQFFKYGSTVFARNSSGYYGEIEDYRIDMSRYGRLNERKLSIHAPCS